MPLSSVCLEIVPTRDRGDLPPQYLRNTPWPGPATSTAAATKARPLPREVELMSFVDAPAQPPIPTQLTVNPAAKDFDVENNKQEATNAPTTSSTQEQPTSEQEAKAHKREVKSLPTLQRSPRVGCKRHLMVPLSTKKAPLSPQGQVGR